MPFAIVGNLRRRSASDSIMRAYCSGMHLAAPRAEALGAEALAERWGEARYLPLGTKPGALPVVPVPQTKELECHGLA